MSGLQVTIQACDRWFDSEGVQVNAWDRVDSKTYVCEARGTPTIAIGGTKTEDGTCQIFCDFSQSPNQVYFGSFVHDPNVYQPTLMSNPYVLNYDPKDCQAVYHKCNEYIDQQNPLNNISIFLHGSEDLKSCYFNNGNCSSDTKSCHVCDVLKAIHLDGYPKEESILGLRGSPESCLFNYLGIGTISESSICYAQIGGRCRNVTGEPLYCFNDKRKTEGITNYGANDGPPEFWCYYTNWAQYRDQPYKTDPLNPPKALEKCTGVIYAFGTIKEVATKADADADPFFKIDQAVAPPGYPLGQRICTEFEWNDDKQIPAVTALNVPVLLSIGGWTLGTEPWTNATYTDASRANFVKSCLDLMEKYNFDGLDIDWEAPNYRGGIPEDIVNYGKLGAELKAEITARGGKQLLTTAIMVGRPINSYFEMGKNHVHFDKVFLMAYDLHGGWDPTTRLCQTAWDIGTGCGIGGVECTNQVDYFYLRYGVGYYAQLMPIQKLGMGLAFYGRGWMKNAGGWETIPKKYSPQLKEVGVMGYAELMNLYGGCKNIDQDQLCCMDTIVPEEGVELLVGWDNVETMKLKVNAAYEEFGIRTFMTWTADFDILPGLDGHGEVIDHVMNLEKTSSESKSLLEPTYQIGTGQMIVCGGIQATVEGIIFTTTPYKEFIAVKGFTNLYISDYQKLTGCTPGEPSVTVQTTNVFPANTTGYGVDINTFLPVSLTNPPPGATEKYIIFRSSGGGFTFYNPKVQLSCQEVNYDLPANFGYVELNQEFFFNTPKISPDNQYLMIPEGLHYFMDEYEYAVDYINFKSICMDYKVDSLPSCISITCGGDPDCATDYAGICNNAGTIITDAKRSAKLISMGREELEKERLKATMFSYETVEEVTNSRQWGGTGNATEEEPHKAQGRAILGGIAIGIAVAAGAVAGAALGVAITTSEKVDDLEAKTDLNNEAIMTIGNAQITISKKLDQNIQAVNNRITDMQNQLNDNFEIVSKNLKGLETGLSDLSTLSEKRFKVQLGYNSWYQQMVSLKDQLTQAAIQMNHKVSMIKFCTQSLLQGKMNNCPSEQSIFKVYPGLMNTHTVRALRYSNEKLIIVNYLPQKLTPFSKIRLYPMPIIMDGEVCWPNYALENVNGTVTGPLECTNRFCDTPSPASTWEKCQKNITACSLHCSPCYRDVCYSKETGITYRKEGEITANFTISPLREFNSIALAQNINVTDLITSLVFEELEDLKPINTSAELVSITEDINQLQEDLIAYQLEYDSLDFASNLLQSPTLWGIIAGLGLNFLITLILLGVVAKRISPPQGAPKGYRGVNQNINWEID